MPSLALQYEIEAREDHGSDIIGIEREVTAIIFNLGNGKRLSVGTTGPIHKPDGTPINTDIDVEGNIYISRDDSMLFGFRGKKDSSYTIVPRLDYPHELIHIGPLEELQPNGKYRPMVLGRFNKNRNKLTWQGNKFRLMQYLTGDGIIRQLTVSDDSANTGWRMRVDLEALLVNIDDEPDQITTVNGNLPLFNLWKGDWRSVMGMDEPPASGVFPATRGLLESHIELIREDDEPEGEESAFYQYYESADYVDTDLLPLEITL